MKVFVWDSVEKLTGNYHSEGGLVVFANDIDRAIKLAVLKGVTFSGEEPVDVRDCAGDQEKVFLFPDAGCC